MQGNFQIKYAPRIAFEAVCDNPASANHMLWTFLQASRSFLSCLSLTPRTSCHQNLSAILHMQPNPRARFGHVFFVRSNLCTSRSTLWCVYDCSLLHMFSFCFAHISPQQHTMTHPITQLDGQLLKLSAAIHVRQTPITVSGLSIFRYIIHFLNSFSSKCNYSYTVNSNSMDWVIAMFPRQG